MDEAAAQQLYEKMVALEEKSRALDQHLRGIQDQLQTLAQTRDTIKELQALPTATETWIPIAPGAYVRGTVSPAATVLLAVGAGVAVEKSPEAVMATLQGHEDALTDVADDALGELKEVFAEMDVIKAQVESTEQQGAHAHKGHEHPHHTHEHHHDHGSHDHKHSH
jgi:prefoldin alpha subunit